MKPLAPRIGITGDDRAALASVAASVAAALGDSARVSTLTGRDRGPDVDLVAVVVTVDRDDGLAPLARARAAHRARPLLALGQGVTADLAVEIVRCAADDFLSLPVTDAAALARKVARLVGPAPPEPVFDWPLLEPLRRTRGYAGRNRRHCFRAATTRAARARVVLIADGRPLACELDDLSIATDGWDGGMRLRVGADDLPDVPRAWRQGGVIHVAIELPDGAPVAATARLVRGPTRAAASLHLAMQLVPNDAAGERRLRAFWLGCQRPIPGSIPG